MADDKDKKKNSNSVEAARAAYQKAVEAARANPHDVTAARRLIKARKRMNAAYRDSID
jgi:hypothetical protein